MTTRIPAIAALPVFSASAAVLLALTACSLVPGHHAAVSSPPRVVPPSALALALDPHSAQERSTATRLLTADARPAEHVVLIDVRTGAAIDSFTFPPMAGVSLPVPPGPVPRHATTFQRAQHRQQQARYAMLRQSAISADRRSWQRQITAIVGSALRVVTHQAGRWRRAHPADVVATLKTAAAGFTSLAQAGVQLGGREVVAVLGHGLLPSATALSRAGRLFQDGTVLISGFQFGSRAVASWQASLLQAGAAGAALLTPAAESQLPAVTRKGLAGRFRDIRVVLFFGRGQDSLTPAALTGLRRLLYLLSVSYPSARAYVHGYTDNLHGWPGGNQALSAARSGTVVSWLVRHGIAAARLAQAGHGSADPAAANGPGGQPLNRRVVIVVSPVG